MDKIYITKASLFYHKYNKEYVLKLQVEGDKLVITTTRNIKSEIAQIVLKEARFNLSSLENVEGELELPISIPIGIEGVVFRAHVPPMYKLEGNRRMVIDTVEDFYVYYIQDESLESYIYLKIRRVMRYRLFSLDSSGNHLFGIPSRKSLLKQLVEFYDKLIFELSKEGRKGYTLPENRMKEYALTALPDGLKRADVPELPEVSEFDVVRHYTNISNKNFGVDTGFYPLGSCTMKYNPKINEEICSLPAFTGLHPLQPAVTAQGALEVYYNLFRALAEIAGLAEFTLNPFAGAHGELTGLMIMRQYHIKRGDLKRTKVIVPDSAHGTNPASAAVCGLTGNPFHVFPARK